MLVQLIVALIVLGLLLWLVQTLLPIDARIKQVVSALLVLLVVLWAVQAFGLLDFGSHRHR